MVAEAEVSPRDRSKHPPHTEFADLRIGRGMRVSVPTEISATTVDYFIPSQLAQWNAELPPLRPSAIASNRPRDLPGPWLLVGARHGVEEATAEATQETARVARALTLLGRTPLTVADLLQANAVLAGTASAGHIRDAISWIEGRSPACAKRVPPPSSAVPGLLQDVLEFQQRSNVALWVKQALMYYQMVHIHPFADGNGRFSRALVAASGGALPASRAESLLVAAAIALNKNAITEQHAAVREGSPGRYLSSWHALQEWAVARSMALSADEETIANELAAVCGSTNTSALLLPLLANHARLRTSELAAGCRWSARNTPTYLARLSDAGWLARTGGATDEWTSPRMRAIQHSIISGTREETSIFFA